MERKIKSKTKRGKIDQLKVYEGEPPKTVVFCEYSLNDIKFRIYQRNEVFRNREKKVKKAGCYFVRNGKTHPIWFSPITGKEFQLSHHKSEEAKFGTQKSISRDAGVKL